MTETSRIYRAHFPSMTDIHDQSKELCRILSEERKPIGYIDVAVLKAKWEAGQATPVCCKQAVIRGYLINYALLDIVITCQEDNVLKHMTKFRRNSSNRYKVITPFTPLDELEDFLKVNLFAIGMSCVDPHDECKVNGLYL